MRNRNRCLSTKGRELMDQIDLIICIGLEPAGSYDRVDLNRQRRKRGIRLFLKGCVIGLLVCVILFLCMAPFIWQQYRNAPAPAIEAANMSLIAHLLVVFIVQVLLASLILILDRIRYPPKWEMVVDVVDRAQDKVSRILRENPGILEDLRSAGHGTLVDMVKRLVGRE